MPKSTSLKIQHIFGSPVRILFLVLIVSVTILGAPLSLKNTPYFHPNASVSIVIFYTTWCPPCQRSLALLDTIQKSHPNVALHRVCVDDAQSQKKAIPYGLAQSIPLILIAGHDGTIVKRFNTPPDIEILNALIQRVEEGRLENGTLPIEQRLDTWKMNRMGM